MAGIARAVKPIGTVESEQQREVGVARVQGDERCAGRAGCEPGDDDRPLAEPGNESPGEQRHRCRDDRHRQQGEARVQRVQPAQPLQTDGQAEDAPVEAEVEQEADRDGGREGRVPEDGRVDQRSATVSFEEDECRRRRGPGDQRARASRAPPSRAHRR